MALTPHRPPGGCAPALRPRSATSWSRSTTRRPPPGPAGPSGPTGTGTTCWSTRSRWRHGATALRAVLHEGEQGVDGYALWRVRPGWGDTGPKGEVRVHGGGHHDARARTRRCGDSCSRWISPAPPDAWCCAVDEPMQFMVNEPRRLAASLADALWLRVVDVPAALAARRYAADVDLVVEVTDELIPANAGRWRLIGGPDGARCESTVDERRPRAATSARWARPTSAARRCPRSPPPAWSRELRPGALADGRRRRSAGTARRRCSRCSSLGRSARVWAVTRMARTGPRGDGGSAVSRTRRRRRRGPAPEAQTDGGRPDDTAGRRRAEPAPPPPRETGPQPRRAGPARARRRRLVPGLAGGGACGPGTPPGPGPRTWPGPRRS